MNGIRPGNTNRLRSKLNPLLPGRKGEGAGRGGDKRWFISEIVGVPVLRGKRRRDAFRRRRRRWTRSQPVPCSRVTRAGVGGGPAALFFGGRGPRLRWLRCGGPPPVSEKPNRLPLRDRFHGNPLLAAPESFDLDPASSELGSGSAFPDLRLRERPLRLQPWPGSRGPGHSAVFSGSGAAEAAGTEATARRREYSKETVPPLRPRSGDAPSRSKVRGRAPASESAGPRARLNARFDSSASPTILFTHFVS